MSTTDPGIAILIHGESKTGKTWLAATSPSPRLILDAEGGTRFLSRAGARLVHWDGMGEPPTDDGTWDTCIVPVRDFNTMRTAYQWLLSGRTPFRSVIIDSLSEVQQRCVDSIAGTSQLTQQAWGDLLRQMSSLVRLYRDLATHPTHPLAAVY